MAWTQKPYAGSLFRRAPGTEYRVARGVTFVIPLRLFRALRAQIPDRATRLAILRAKSGVAGLFRVNPSLGRVEVNSIEFMTRVAGLEK